MDRRAAMHIGVDGRELVGQPTGVGRYVREILRAWLADPSSPHRFTLFLPSPATPDLQTLGPRVSIVTSPAAVAGTQWEQTRLPRLVARAGLDVLFAPAYTAPLAITCPLVVAVYDVSYFAHPEWFSWREGLRRRVFTRLAARRARAIVTISEFSAGEIVRWLGVPRDRILLAPPGAPPVEKYGGAGFSPPREHARASSRPPIVLYVGTLLERRHIPDLIRGFALAARDVPEARLILVGANRSSPPVDPVRVAADAGVEHQVEWRSYVEDADLAALYGTARVFAFLSDYEGFGMTPFEAIAHGVPPIVLDTPVSREVYGDGARRVTAAPPEIARAIVSLLTDEAAHAAQLAAGRARLASFSWTESAARILEALTQAAGR